jgi:hypothetical protein
MTEESGFSTGRSAELERAGYNPVKLPRETGDSGVSMLEAQEIDGRTGDDAARAGAEALRVRRAEQELPILETRWHGAPETAFEDAATAAEVLKASRQRYAAERVKPEQESRADEFAKRIDALRGEPSEPQLSAQIEHDNAAAAETERQRIMADINARAVAEQGAKIDTAQQRIADRRSVLIATLAADFPELDALSPEQIPTALAALEQRNPQRAQQFNQRVAVVQQLRQVHDQVTQRKAAHENQQFTHWGNVQDQNFEQQIAKETAERRQAVKGEVVNVLQDYGMSPQRFIQLASSLEGGFLRQANVQRLLYDLAASRLDGKRNAMARKELERKVVPPNVPPVARPGTSQASYTRTNADGLNARRLAGKLANSTGELALRAAADLLTARRKGR